MAINKKYVCSVRHTSANVFMNGCEISSNVMSASRTQMCRRNINSILFTAIYYTLLINTVKICKQKAP
jgi:hypothetical protein